jgi:VanZ family protein
MSTGSQAVGRHGLRLALLWWLCVAVWTVALLTPQPARASREVLTPTTGYRASKTLHVAVYAFLAGTLPWLGPRGGRRWWLVGFLSLHAAGTELLQRWVPDRTGSLTDVGIDHLGILLGLACTWAAWRHRE